jgi:hypothetical protein
MNSGLFKKILPHLIAIIVFLVVSVFFCKPALEGNVLNQSDIIGWKGMSHDAFEYKEQHGRFPLWNTHLFSGMPNYQVAMEGKTVMPDVTKILSLWLPKPMNFFFLACICFYILCLAFRLNPVVGILGGLAFAFSTYNPIIVGVGHESKMFAIAAMPLLMAGMILTYEKKYWIGLVVATLGAYLEIGVNHPQINFYFLLIALAVTIAYLVLWIKRGEWKHILISGAIILGAALLGVGGSAVTLLTTAEYAKATMRGGKNISIEGNQVTKANTSGLDTSYAFQYSYGKAETVTMLMPKAFGERSGTLDGRIYALDENSNVIEKLSSKGIPESSAMQLAAQLPRYWGGLEQTSGPVYYGVLICLLALIGFVLVKHPVRWGLLAVSILGIFMSWGKFLPGFNTFLFDNLPLYNKFRAPSMSLVITEFTIPLMAVLGLQQVLYRDKAGELLKADFKKILYAVGGLFGLLALMYLMMSYSSPIDQEIFASLSQQGGNEDAARAVISGMKEDRKEMFGGQLLRAFGFALLLLGLIYLYLKNILKPVAVTIAIVALTAFDLLSIDKDYLNEESFKAPEELSSEHFVPTPAEQQILNDKEPHYRVFNASANPVYDLRSAYFFRSVGGYHPARLRIYQDLIDKYLGGGPNETVLNMLNTKYLLINNPQTNQQQVLPNQNAYGPVWLVKNVRLVNGPVEEIQAIGTANLKDTAIVQKEFSNSVIQPQADSAATIKLTKFDNDNMEYSFNSTTPQFAVFSEVYYPYGWNAYIDGKKVNYTKANYVLRGLSIPAGQHAIKFVFEPESYTTGKNIQFISSIIILLLVFGGLFMQWRSTRNTQSVE